LKELKIGIAGLGVVAQGLLEILRNNGTLIAERTGVSIKVARVASRSERPGVDLMGAEFSKSIDDLCKDSEVDVVVELMGGVEVAKDLIHSALASGKKVVTANKAVIALHGNELLNEETRNRLKFEASVAGAIPIINLLQGSLVSNRIQQLVGIINGTCNYILTAMEQQSLSFESALQKAQELGFAEADPSFDIDGIDAAHKLTILLSLAFDMPFDFEKIFVEGIRSIAEKDIIFASELGYRIKHVGILRNHDGRIEARVHPALIPKEQLLANVLFEQNAVSVIGDASGRMLFSGPGAGSLPTASAVFSDLLDLGSDNGLKPQSLRKESTKPLALELIMMDEVCVPHYLRINVLDKPGIMADITKVLSESEISIEAVIQKESENESDNASIIILTNAVEEHVMQKAILTIDSLPEVSKGVVDIRLESMS
tara:strand:- start:456 stop:1742 length:1287 start_codon:yes stop_codon:yes gene_type:complete